MEEQTRDVNTASESQEAVSGDVKPQPQEAEVSEDTKTKPVQAGDKTDPNLLLKSLKEERERNKQLEKELETLKSSDFSETDEAISDEGKLLDAKIKALEAKIDNLSHESAKKDLQLSNPLFKERWDEFEEFRSDPDNKGMNMRTAAKAFLAEHGLLEPRKGLEKATGGPRTPIPTGMSQEDIRILRETNFRKYQELLKKGQIKI